MIIEGANGILIKNILCSSTDYATWVLYKSNEIILDVIFAF